MKVRKSTQLNCCQVGECSGVLCIDTRDFIDDMYFPCGFELLPINNREGITYEQCCPHDDEYNEQSENFINFEHYYNSEGTLLFYYHVHVKTNCDTGESFNVNVDYFNDLNDENVSMLREVYIDGKGL